jgi:hypothetical protein
MYSIIKKRKMYQNLAKIYDIGWVQPKVSEYFKVYNKIQNATDFKQLGLPSKNDMLKLAVTDNFNFVNFIKEYSIFDKNV